MQVGSCGVLRSERGRIGAWTVCALATVCLVLLLAPAAGANVPSSTWTGGAAAGSPGWMQGTNWQGGSAPSLSGPVALEFPQLTSLACMSDPISGTCYKSENDVGDLDVESLRMDDGDEYELTGDEITLGAGGLTASPANGTSGRAGDVLELPVRLGAAQTWSVAGREGGAVGENGMLVGDGLTGPGEALTVDMSDSPVLYLEGDTEIGPIAIDGTKPGAAGGVVLASGELNGADGDLVSLSHVGFEGKGTVGTLSASAAELVLAGRLEAASATFDASSRAIFAIAVSSNSELASDGTIELGGSSIGFAIPASCPEVTVGHVYTLISTTGALSGAFDNAPEGQEIPIAQPEGCRQLSQDLQIAYHESGPTQTVTATVVQTSGVGLPLPVNTYNPYVRAEASVEWGAISGAESGARYWEEKRAREEAERLAHAAQQPAKSPAMVTEVSLASTDIMVQSNGTALVKLKCTGSENCAGRLTLTAETASKGGKNHSYTTKIGAASYSVTADETAVAKLELNTAGRALLSTDHGRLSAHLTIAESASGQAHTQTKGVRLVERKTRSGKHGK